MSRPTIPLSRSSHRRTLPGVVATGGSLLCLALAGCLPIGGWPFGQQPTEPATPPVSVPATATPSVPPASPTVEVSVPPATVPPATVTTTVTAPPPPPAKDPGSGARTISGSTLGFASPTGNLVCTMRASGPVICHATQATWKGSAVPVSKQRNCEEFGPFGPWDDVALDDTGAFGLCVTEINTLEAYLTWGGEPNEFGKEFRSWYEPGRDKVVVPEKGIQLPVLPYGGVATTGRYRCTMATTGVTCTDTKTGHGFSLARAKIEVR